MHNIHNQIKRGEIMRQTTMHLRTMYQPSATTLDPALDTINHQGGHAWNKSIKEKLFQMAMTGTLTNSFYVSQEDMVCESAKLLESAEANDIAVAIVKGRNEGFIRAFNILGLVILSKKSPTLFREVFPEVVKTGNDLEDFIGMCRSVRKFGRSVKTAMTNWISKNLSEHYAIKYRRQIADAMRIAHPVLHDTTAQPTLAKYVSAHYHHDESMTFNSLNYDLTVIPMINAMELAKNAINEKDYKKASKLIIDNRLDPMTIIGCGFEDNILIWTALAKVMPVMMTLKYLNKLIRSGAYEKCMQEIHSKLCVKNLKSAKVFPFRLVTAIEAIDDASTMDTAKHNVELIAHLNTVTEKYVTEYDWTSLNTKSFAICPDVSGSMTSPVKNGIVPSKISALFTAFFLKGLDNAIVLPWDTVLHKLDTENTSLFDIINTIKNSHGGGTCMTVPLDHLSSNHIKRDIVMIITDSENMDCNVQMSWLKYRKQFPTAKLVFLRVDSYSTNPVSDVFSEENDVYQIYGWNDNVIKFIEYVI